MTHAAKMSCLIVIYTRVKKHFLKHTPYIATLQYNGRIINKAKKGMG